MINIFDVVDGIEFKVNLLRDDVYLRKVFTYFSVAMIVVWLILGFDSGVGLLERAVPNIPALLRGSMSFGEWVDDAMVLYGRTFHFSAFVTYGLLFVGLSGHLARLGVVRSRNIFYSIFLVALNVSCFELIWMSFFTKFQMDRNLLEWLHTDWWFLGQWFAILFLGILGLVAVYVDSFKGLFRLYRLKWSFKPFFWLGLTVGLWFLWVYYPFPVIQVSYDGWTSSLLFPQTFYAYKIGQMYLQNDLLHALNVLVKGLFAVTELSFLRRFQRV